MTLQGISFVLFNFYEDVILSYVENNVTSFTMDNVNKHVIRVVCKKITQIKKLILKIVEHYE